MVLTKISNDTQTTSLDHQPVHVKLEFAAVESDILQNDP